MARRPKDHYDALGVSRNAKAEDIRKAFRQKAKEHHPDATGGGDAIAFRAAQEAYEALRDPAARRAYDEELRRSETFREPPRGGGRPFSSPYDRPFDSNSGRPRGTGRERARGPSPGSMDEMFQGEDELFNRILQELFGGGTPGGADPGSRSRESGSRGRSAFGGFGDMFSDPEEGGYSSRRRGHRHLRDEEPLSVVVHLSPDESYTGGTVSVDIGAGRSILASIPPGVHHGDVIRSEFYDSEGPRELKLHIRVG